jgi:REP element-mobilizing transposase RayT
MPPEPLPDRAARGCGHIPPLWVESSATFFITINCKPRGLDHLTRGDIPNHVLDSVAFLANHRRWFPELVLLMPDHLHALVSFSWEANLGMNRVISDWKRYLATRFGIPWQRDYFDHRIRSESDHQSTWHYIRENPVRAGLAENYEQWPHVWRPEGTGWHTSMP